MEYLLMNGDHEAAYLSLEDMYVEVRDNRFLPYMLKDHILTTDLSRPKKALKDISDIRGWLAGRTLSLSRANAKAILNAASLPQGTGTEYRLKIAEACKGLSMSDSFWLKGIGEKSSFSDVCLRDVPLSEASYRTAILGEHISAAAEELRPNLSTEEKIMPHLIPYARKRRSA